MTEQIRRVLRDSKAARWTALFLVSFSMFAGYYLADVLAPLKNLEYLQIANNNVSDISVVINFKNLRYLDAGTNILLENINVVKELQYLNYLDLQSDNIKDLTPIIECLGMRNPSYLNIRHNPLSETAKNEQVPLLQARGVYVTF